MIRKKKPKRVHSEPEYELKNNFSFIPVPPDENQYKQSFREKVVEEWKRAWDNFKNDFYFSKLKKTTKYLEPEMDWRDAIEASRFDPKQPIEKTKEAEEEWNIKYLNPNFESQQKAATPTKRYKRTLEEKIKREAISELIEDKKDTNPRKPFKESLKKRFKYLKPTKKQEGHLSYHKSHGQLWKKTIISLTASAALATAIFLKSDAEKTQRPLSPSYQKTEKIRPPQKNTLTTKTPTTNFVTKTAQIMQKDPIVYTVKKGDILSKIVKQYDHKSGSELYADVNKVKQLNPQLMKNPDLITPGQKIVLGIKEKPVDKKYKVKLETNGRRTYLNTDGTKISPDLEKRIRLYEAGQNEAKQKPKNNAPKLSKNKYSNIENIVEDYNSAAELFRKSKDKTYLANILDLARESGKTIQATNAYIEHSKDREAIKEIIRENYLHRSKSEIDTMLANKFKGLDTTKVKFTSIMDERYGKGIIRKRSGEQKGKAVFMKKSEELYLNSGQGISEPITAHKENKENYKNA